jgi:hypothetical protein
MCWLVGDGIAGWLESWSVFLFVVVDAFPKKEILGTRVVFRWAVLRCTRGRHAMDWAPPP